RHPGRCRCDQWRLGCGKPAIRRGSKRKCLISFLAVKPQTSRASKQESQILSCRKRRAALNRAVETADEPRCALARQSRMKARRRTTPNKSALQLPPAHFLSDFGGGGYSGMSERPDRLATAARLRSTR